MSSRYLLNCNNLVKNYQEGSLTTSVLKGVNFSLDERELVSIVGSSGSGKSTLLHILGALDTPTSGDVFLMGKSLTEMKSGQQAKLRNEHIGFIYQFHHLLTDFSAIENVAMPMMIAGKKPKEAQSKAKELLELVGLTHRGEHRPSELSGGERQRVAIARSIINNPKVVLADEPTGNLDHKTALAIYDLMRDLNRNSGTAFLIVTHDNELADKMDRKVLMQDGELA
ncbi:lipoprotein-releasing ABC transporter ATP-binding protein LolD [Vibrio viridaestus]|uniref:Lipoprotein-releasing system ATP-binding protein LolD n=1 Tax=Vibrio viridaestus TaxID=2487322 RepID=A0A3N9THF4_9VIBR|nr:lipoprotein-releasing ABC transporter ATP-binding protein LolD [Vibrio viridaestus]RQW63253.1 lipoprotein-releasing ABC transporter ATP-binding protein LolD [Vibrio viridaestus]